MLKKYWDNLTPQFRVLLVPVVAYIAYKVALELWCVAYGLVY
jgi:hypothetical protein